MTLDQHYIDMAKNPGAQAHAWFTADKLAAQACYATLPKQMADAMLLHFIDMAHADKRAAWRAVNELAVAQPKHCGNLPARLTAAMQKAQEGTSQPAGEASASAAGQCGVTTSKEATA